MPAQGSRPGRRRHGGGGGIRQPRVGGPPPTLTLILGYASANCCAAAARPAGRARSADNATALAHGWASSRATVLGGRTNASMASLHALQAPTAGFQGSCWSRACCSQERIARE